MATCDSSELAPRCYLDIEPQISIGSRALSNLSFRDYAHQAQCGHKRSVERIAQFAQERTSDAPSAARGYSL